MQTSKKRSLAFNSGSRMLQDPKSDSTVADRGSPPTYGPHNHVASTQAQHPPQSPSFTYPRTPQLQSDLSVWLWRLLLGAPRRPRIARVSRPNRRSQVQTLRPPPPVLTAARSGLRRALRLLRPASPPCLQRLTGARRHPHRLAPCPSPRHLLPACAPHLPRAAAVPRLLPRWRGNLKCQGTQATDPKEAMQLS